MVLIVMLVHSLVAPVCLLLNRTKRTTKAVAAAFETCAVNLTEVGSQIPALKNSGLEVNTVTNPTMATGAVGVLGVKSGRGVKVEEVAVKSDVGVLVFSPIKVGVSVKVGVEIVAVCVGRSVTTAASGGASVGAVVGLTKALSNPIEQDAIKIELNRRGSIVLMERCAPVQGGRIRGRAKDL